MSGNLKAIWDSLAVDMKNSPDALKNPEIMQRFHKIEAAIGELHKQFENERHHTPFTSQAPCPFCSGTVTYIYKAPLVGSMKCNTPDCFSQNI